MSNQNKRFHGSLLALRGSWEGRGEVLFHRRHQALGCAVSVVVAPAATPSWSAKVINVFRYVSTSTGGWQVSCDYDGSDERAAWRAAIDAVWFDNLTETEETQ
jgi:hypothetical protein